MNPKLLEKEYQCNKNKFYDYISNIKKNMRVDIYSVVNVTLISNPYITKFPLKFFLKDFKYQNKFFLFIKSSFQYYLKNFYLLFGYCISYIIYKIYYKKKTIIINDTMGIDIFFLVDNIIKDNQFNDSYFKNLYYVLDKCNKNYIFMPRLYGIGINPLKLIQLFKILNQDERVFLFEFEYLTFIDFYRLFCIFFLYPFKTLRLLQKEEENNTILFNNELLKDISNIRFDVFSRYIFGKNIAKQNKINKIYSWSEFQVIERSFNYGIRTNTNDIKLIACQFFLNYEIYFNAYVDDLDYDIFTSPHIVLVNGKYYLLDRKKIDYKVGVSLRYNNIFDYKQDKNIKQDKILLLGSYIQNDTKIMLNSINGFRNILFKNHPAVDIGVYKIENNIKIVENNIYKLFQQSNIVLTVASGTAIEAVSCGISVIIIASQDNFTANPLNEYGKGKIWDIAFNKNDVKRLYNKLIEYRNKNKREIKKISSWYKNNFFIEPTEENIIKIFELKR